MLPHILAILGACQLVIAGFYSNTGVVELSSKNFKREVLHNGNVSVVQFYAPWCPHCKNLVTQYTKSAKSLRGIARVCAVDCEDPGNKKLCASYNVQGFPTIKVFQPSKLTDTDFKDVNEGKPIPKRRPRVWDYQGPREYKAINSFAISKLRNYAATLNSELTIPWMKKNKVPRVVMMPGRKFKAKSVAPLFKVLSREYFGKIRFGYLPRREDGAWSLLGLKAPEESQLVYMSDDREPLVYKGSMKKKQIKKFLNEQYDFEMNRRARNGESAEADRDQAANGLEFVIEDEQETEMEHMRKRREEQEREKELILQARREALERVGEDPSRIASADLLSAHVESSTSAKKASIDDGSIAVPDFDEDEDSEDEQDGEVIQFKEFSEDDALLDEIDVDFSHDEVVPEPTNAAKQAGTNTGFRAAEPAHPTPEVISRENGLESLDDILKFCLRNGRGNCVLLVTVPSRKDEDVLVIQHSIVHLPRNVRGSTILHYTMHRDEKVNGLLSSLGLESEDLLIEGASSPRLIYFDPRKRRFSLFDADYTAVDVARFIVAGYDKRLEWQSYPRKYVYWVTDDEAQALKDEL